MIDRSTKEDTGTRSSLIVTGYALMSLCTTVLS